MDNNDQCEHGTLPYISAAVYTRVEQVALGSSVFEEVWFSEKQWFFKKTWNRSSSVSLLSVRFRVEPKNRTVPKFHVTAYSI